MTNGEGGAEYWPDPVERVAAFLRETGAEARLEELFRDSATAEDAADAIGCTLSQIAWSSSWIFSLTAMLWRLRSAVWSETSAK